MKTRTRIALTVLAASATVGAYAQDTPSPTDWRVRSDVVVAQNLPDLQPAPERVEPETRPSRIEVNVGEVPNLRTEPPSVTRRHGADARQEGIWQTPQRGTNATGMWPMPGTGGQPGTIQ